MHWYLFPFSFLYGAIVVIRNKFFDWGWIKSSKFNIPIISVGNISVGGTGKTPHIEYLLSMLIKNNSVATISRGYGRKTRGFIEVKTQSTVKEVGDEPLQIKRKFQESLVIVDEKRVHAVEKLITNNKIPDVILLDDAYQHRHIHRGLNILLIDYNRPITKDYILPVGRLREPAHHSRRADIVIVTKCPSNLTSMDIRIMQTDLNLFPYQKLFFSTFKYNGLKPIFNKKLEYSNITDLKDVEVLVVTGIANPKPLYEKLEESGAVITKLRFADHHNFKKSDLKKIESRYSEMEGNNKIIICTEKDAVRLKTSNTSKSLSNLPFYSLPIEVVLLQDGEATFNNAIDTYITA